MKYTYPNKVPFYKFIFNSSSIAKNPIPFQKRWLKQNNDTFYVKPFLQAPIMVSCDKDVAIQMLKTKHRKFKKSKIQTQFLSKYIGYGLLTSTGDYWLQQRRLIQPGFHKEKIKNLVYVINLGVTEQLKTLKVAQKVELYPVMNELAFEVVAKSLFNYSAEKSTLKRLQFIVEKLQQVITTEIRQPYKKIQFIISGKKAYHKNLVKESRDIIESIIKGRKKTNSSHDDLLQMLLDATYEDGSSMNTEQLIDEILILFVAGHETTANALTFTFALLAMNPPVLNSLYKEIDDVAKQSVSSLEAISKLKYLSACVSESLRLYPPAWITDRVAIDDVDIGSYHIKKGTMIGVSIYELHRNEAYWKNPNEFYPERFIEDDKLLRADYYMPFGAGPRLCIGNNFAMFEMILTVFEVLKKYKITTSVREIEVNPLITLKPVDVHLNFEKR